MSEREKRLALNEALFREINERVEERVGAASPEDRPLTILCECGRLECVERITLSLREYRAAHGHPAQFTVVPGHAAEDVEDVVVRTDRFEVVRKRGLAGEIAAELDDS